MRQRLRSGVLLGTVLALTAFGLPPAEVRQASASLVAVDKAEAVGTSTDVTWVLLLGSDARPGEPVLRSRADAIQLVGINARTGAGTVIGIPRDSYVDIAGVGRGRVNSALTYGGPQLMASTVGSMVGVAPDYVFTASFGGFIALVDAIGGITVDSKYAFSDPVRPRGYRVGRNRVNGLQAMVFARIRKSFPNGDFDRSANQQRTLLGILRRVRANVDRPGFVERGVLSAVRHLDTDLSPAQLFRLAATATQISPERLRTCVVRGTIGYAGAANVVFPDLAQARSIGSRAGPDAKLEGPC